MDSVTGPVLPIHVADVGFGGGTRQNIIYCRRCLNRWGGAYGAISARATEWRFCPYCGIEVVRTNAYHQPPEAEWRPSDWATFTPPDRWDLVDARYRDKAQPLQLEAAQSKEEGECD